MGVQKCNFSEIQQCMPCIHGINWSEDYGHFQLSICQDSILHNHQ